MSKNFRRQNKKTAELNKRKMIVRNVKRAAVPGNREGERSICIQGRPIIRNKIEPSRSVSETPFEMSQANERLEHSNWNKREKGGTSMHIQIKLRTQQ